MEGRRLRIPLLSKRCRRGEKHSSLWLPCMWEANTPLTHEARARTHAWLLLHHEIFTNQFRAAKNSVFLFFFFFQHLLSFCKRCFSTIIGHTSVCSWLNLTGPGSQSICVMSWFACKRGERHWGGRGRRLNTKTGFLEALSSAEVNDFYCCLKMIKRLQVNN